MSNMGNQQNPANIIDSWQRSSINKWCITMFQSEYVFCLLIFLQTCVIDRTKNQIKGCPPCQEVIERIMADPVCKQTRKYLIKIHRLYKLCPTLFTGERLNFKAYHQKGMDQMESCQMSKKGVFKFILIKYWSSLAISFKERVCFVISYAGTYFCWRYENAAIYFNILSNSTFCSDSLEDIINLYNCLLITPIFQSKQAMNK